MAHHKSGAICMTKRCFALLAILFAISATRSHAATVDFEDIGVSQGSETTISDVISGGFLFDSLTNHFHRVWDKYSSHNGTRGLGSDNENGDDIITMSRVDGENFLLRSIDFTEAFGVDFGTRASAVLVTGYYATGGLVQKTVQIDGIADGAGPLNDFQTEVFPTTWTGLSSVTFNPTGGSREYFGIDNIVIPEPTTLLLVATGLLGITCLRRPAK